ncbi:PREDICTED: la-related protein 6B isoform X1 [Lupinus angustifolius]|uniref:la-related protein 6B isoform X1 n=1 Tax=Lupinus angustifolius TaxID=3871 RepID=UPI00092F0D98|nr:PREDICTED: la-related protein 6B isoform X1 [Lupinus angustifolius]
MALSSETKSDSRNVSFSRLNAQAPEFVPTPRPNLLHLYQPVQSLEPVQRLEPVPVQNHHQQQQRHHHHGSVQFHRSSNHQQVEQVDHGSVATSSKTKHFDEANQKILNQVEYYFSDLNLATTDHLMKFISKDPEGFVPISVVASFKKIKALITSHSQLATVLRSSSKLVVSEDGKKVKRQYPLTESDLEELQSRIVIAENLPEDHCHQNLMKVFSVVGSSVKTIRTCPPQHSSSGTSSASRGGKADGMPLYSKLHAFVEYESVELAERAVAELNDEGNWRSGLRLRLMLRRTSKHGPGRAKKGLDVEFNGEEDYTSVPEQQQQTNEKQIEDAPFPDTQLHEHVVEEHGYEKDNNGPKKGRNRGKGKGRGRGHHHHGHHIHIGTPQPSNNSTPPPGPRMPDGTRGFSMGRGKPNVALVNNIA